MADLTVASLGNRSGRTPTRFGLAERFCSGNFRRAPAVIALLLMVVVLGAGCEGATHQGTIRGTLLTEGGPPPGYHRTEGQVTLVNSQGHQTVKTVPKSGSFAIQIPPGTYRVSGSIPQLKVTRAQCVSEPGISFPTPGVLPARVLTTWGTVTVTAGATARVLVLCPIYR